ncbi:SlyX family protein [Myxococcota bacterium]|nr:SlyX family protein [Myxococcota bacterium]
MESRVTDLEVRLAFLEQSIADLDGVVRELGEHVDAMRVELGQVRIALSREIASTGDLADEKPPHW